MTKHAAAGTTDAPVASGKSLVPGYDGSTFTAFFPEPPTDADLGNFNTGRIPQVMFFWNVATPERLRQYCNIVRHRIVDGVGGVRHTIAEHVRAVLRIDTMSLIDMALHPDGVVADFQTKIAAAGPGGIVGLILGNEWDRVGDAQRSLRWHRPDGSIPDWGNQLEPAGRTIVDTMLYYVGQVAWLLGETARQNGITLVSPAYSMRGYTEDDAPDPGLFTWRELTAPLFYGSQDITGNGVHYYDGGWWVRDPAMPPDNKVALDLGSVLSVYTEKLIAARCATQANVHRFEHAIRFWSGYHHHRIWIDEANTLNSFMSEAEHMEACVGKSKLLREHRNPEGYLLGERVAMYSPFASNGLANAYPAQYVMRDPASYVLVRAHMEECGYA